MSFVEIFMTKGVPALESGGWGEDGSYRYGTLLFFGGMVVTFMLDLLVHFISRFAGKNKEHDPNIVTEIPRDRSLKVSASLPDATKQPTSASSTPFRFSDQSCAPQLPPTKDIETGEDDVASSNGSRENEGPAAIADEDHVRCSPPKPILSALTYQVPQPHSAQSPHLRPPHSCASTDAVLMLLPHATHQAQPLELCVSTNPPMHV